MNRAKKQHGNPASHSKVDKAVEDVLTWIQSLKLNGSGDERSKSNRLPTRDELYIGMQNQPTLQTFTVLSAHIHSTEYAQLVRKNLRLQAARKQQLDRRKKAESFAQLRISLETIQSSIHKLEKDIERYRLEVYGCKQMIDSFRYKSYRLTAKLASHKSKLNRYRHLLQETHQWYNTIHLNFRPTQFHDIYSELQLLITDSSSNATDKTAIHNNLQPYAPEPTSFHSFDEILRIQIQSSLEAEEFRHQTDRYKTEYQSKCAQLQTTLSPTYYELVMTQCSAYELSLYHAHLSTSFKQLEDQAAQYTTSLSSLSEKSKLVENIPTQIQARIESLLKKAEDCRQMITDIPIFQENTLSFTFNDLNTSFRKSRSLSSQLSLSIRSLWELLQTSECPPLPLPFLDYPQLDKTIPQTNQLFQASLMSTTPFPNFFLSPLHRPLIDSFSYDHYKWYHSFECILPYLFLSYKKHWLERSLHDIKDSSQRLIISNLSRYISDVASSVRFPSIIEFSSPQTLRSRLSKYHPQYVQLIEYVQLELNESNALTLSLQTHFKELLQRLAHQSSYATFQALSMLSLDGMNPEQWRASMRLANKPPTRFLSPKTKC